MPGKKKKYNARFPPARIKKIMQSDEEVGKVAAPVPVIISRALELFTETLLMRAKKVTAQRGARTLTPSHMKFCIQSEKRFDFLKDLVSSVPELQGDMDHVDTEGPGLLTSELRLARPGAGGVAGGGRGRGSGGGAARPGRPLVPGTGRKRGRPPKALGAPPSARTKRLLDDNYEMREVIEVENGASHGDASPAFHLNLASASSHQQLGRLQHELAHYNKLSSPFSVSLPGSPSSASAPSVTRTPGEAPHPSYQRTNSLPPPAPVYSPARSLFKSPGLTPIAPKPSWPPSPLQPPHQSNSAFPEASNGHHPGQHPPPTLKLQPPETNGHLGGGGLPPLSSTSTAQPRQPDQASSSFQSPQLGPAFAAASVSSTHELDEDYDC